MAEYNITSPSGEKFKITAPDDATQDQVLSYAQQQFAQQPTDFSIPTEKALRTSSVPIQPKQNFSLIQKIIGAAEVPTTLAGGALGLVKGIFGGGQGKTYEESIINAAQQTAGNELFAPRTEAGKAYTENLLNAIEASKLPPILPEVAALPRIAPVSGMPLNQTLNKLSNVSLTIANKAKETALKPAKLLTEPFKAVKAGLYDPIVNQQDLIASTLVRNIGKENIPEVISGLSRKAQTPQVQFSAAQATGNPALAALEDTLRAVSPSGELNLQSSKNREILANKVRNIAQDELAVESAKNTRRNITEPLYKSLEQQTYMGGSELDSLLARANASGALSEAKRIAGIRGTQFDLPVIEQPTLRGITQEELAPVFQEGLPKEFGKMPITKQPVGITGFLKQRGGINTEHILDVTGEKSVNKSGATIGLFTKNGRGLDDAVQTAVEGNYLSPEVLNEVDGGVSALSDIIQNEIRGNKAIPLGSENEIFMNQYLAKQEQPVSQIGMPSNVPAPRPPDTVIGTAIKGRDLINLKKGIDEAIAKSQPGSPTRTELFNLKNDYAGWLENRSSGFLEANKQFSKLSKPINQMQVGKLLSEKLIPATAEETPSSLNAAQLAKALKNKDAIARVATGFNGSKLNKILTPKQLKTILGINSDASRMAEIQKLGAGYGSPTARRLSATEFIGENFKQQAPITSNIIEILNHVPLLNYATKGVGTGGKFIANKLNASMSIELDRLLATDPIGLANALKKELNNINAKQIKVDYINPLSVSPGLLGAVPYANLPLQQYKPSLLQTNPQGQQ